MRRSNLYGHKGSITCIEAVCSSLVASGSEDKMVRVWDVRNNKTVLGIAGCFSNAVENIKVNTNNNNIINVASGNSIHTFDIRLPTMILRESISMISITNNTEDEIYSLALHSSGNIAAADDDGNVIAIPPVEHSSGIRIPSNSQEVYRRFSNVHTNIVNCLAFPRMGNNHPSTLLSGSFDCKACLWNFQNGQPIAVTTFQHLCDGENVFDASGQLITSTARSQLLNPPFVMGLGYICYDTGVVAALGDGTLRILRSKDLSTVRSMEVHSGMITALQLSDKYTVSGGIDRKICLFDNDPLSLARHHNSNNSPADSSHDSTDNTSIKLGKKKLGKKQRDRLKRNQNNNNSNNSDELNLKLLLTMQHTDKVNTLCAALSPPAQTLEQGDASYAAGLNSKIFVGDTTPTLSIYDIE